MRHLPDDENGDVPRRLEEHGANFELEVLHDDAEGRSELMAARRMTLDHAAITAAEELLGATVRQHGGEPDGWGTMQEEC